MALESNNYNQNFGFGLNGSMYGNNPMNPTLNNSFTNHQLAYNMSQKTPTPVNLNFPNSAQGLAIGGSSMNSSVQNFYVDPFLSSSISAPGTHHSANLYKEYPGLIHSNVSSHQAPMAFQAHATNPRVNIQEFGSSSSANPCINGARTVAYPKTKKKKERNNKNGMKGHWIQDEDRMLLALVEKYGTKKWSYIARMMPGRLGKQLRERYNNHLKPGLKVLFCFPPPP